MLNRLIMALAGFAFLQLAAPENPPAQTPLGAAAYGPSPDAFTAWRDGFRKKMQAAGHNEDAIAQIINDVAFDPKVETHLATQAEFTKPLWKYVQDRTSPYAIQKGRSAVAANAALFSGVEERFGAPKEIVAAIWGMESGYGAFTGDIDAPSALATMATHLDRRTFAERQLEALIAIVEHKYAARAQLKGSWSAAMGHTQFIPTTYLERAVDWNNDGIRDVWGAPDDALASTANFMKVAGWRMDQPWGLEVKLGGSKALKYADSATHPMTDFTGAGVKKASGAAWTKDELERQGRLFLPAGRTGPIFIVFPNFDAIKEYNRSEAYALSVALLGEAIAGRPGLVTPWPRNLVNLSPDEVRKLQAGLTALGYPAGELDGKIGTQTRIALHAFQIAKDLPADGFPTPEALQQVVAAVTSQPQAASGAPADAQTAKNPAAPRT